MNLKDSISIVAQINNVQFTEKDIQFSSGEVVGINPELGLMVLAQGECQAEDAAAYKSVEIMLDDMELNLKSTINDSSLSSSMVDRCISESLENINEYLYFQAERKAGLEKVDGVDLAVVQIQQNNISCCNVGSLSCLRFSGDELQVLGKDSAIDDKLGIKTALQSTIVEKDFSEGDTLLLTSPDLVSQLGHDFIRVTLSRFNDNLEMALRQINTRALRHDFEQKPVIIICRRIHTMKQSRNWFNKMLNH
ncbi:MAG: hypothetical protein HN349_05780 [Gammaproteobacteria bacterium]|nr:hypothetical protein [Gammaproteobacteria bacterium]